jgi:alpha-L-fucosidase
MKYEITRPISSPGDTEWFQKDRFGLFLHWGTYTLAARHEWMKSNEQTGDEAYMQYFRHFDPDLFSPAAWAKEAANAGMKYFVVTTKHHEGFCLWDSAYTDFKATNTPFGRDVLKPIVEAFRNEGLRAGFYHSLLDWHHPEYTVDRHHPMRENPEFIRQSASRNMGKYVEYLHNQSRELMTQFGRVDILWYDFSVREGMGFPGKGADVWKSEELIKLVRSLQPGIILNDRLGIEQDLHTPEQYQPREWVTVGGKPVLWEACQTLSGSWGYYRDEYTWKSVDMLVQMLIDTVSKGGNLLLNVGPTGRGEFDERALERLRGMGAWMKRHGRSIYGCTQAPKEFICPQDCRLTYNPETNRLYVHVFAWPYRHLHLDGYAGRVEYAQLLNDASEIKMTEQNEDVSETELIYTPSKKGTITLELPVRKPDVTVPVIELFLK